MACFSAVASLSRLPRRTRDAVPSESCRYAGQSAGVPAKLCIVACFCVTNAPQVPAQRVRGIISSDGAVPISGAIILVTRDSDVVVARSLASADGRFVVTVPSPGGYRLRAIRLGFRPSAPLSLQVGPPGLDGVRISMTPVAVDLTGVVVEAERQCDVKPESSTIAFRAWESAQAALLSNVVAQEQHHLQLAITLYERTTTSDGSLVKLEQQTRSGNAFTPFAAQLSPAEFVTRGYVEEDPEGAVTYRAPDATVILSPEFVDSHCFGVTRSERDHQGEIGLTFQPTSRQNRIADVRGTLWLDRSTSELRTLEWAYTHIADAAEAAGAGGRISFAQLRSGAWVVTEWSLRMPVVTEQRATDAYSSTLRSMPQRIEHVVHTIQETGGFVASVRDDGEEVWAPAIVPRVVRVLDGETGSPVPGALVTLRGVMGEMHADSMGRVRLPYLLPGPYVATVVRPSLASPGVGYDVPLKLDKSGVTPNEVTIAGATDVVRIACDGQYEGTDRAIVSGTVRLNDGTPPAHAILVRGVSRGDIQGLGSRGAASSTHEVWTRTDAAGRYHLCGLPWDEEVIVQLPEEKGAPGEGCASTAPHGTRWISCSGDEHHLVHFAPAPHAHPVPRIARNADDGRLASAVGASCAGLQ